MTHDIYMVGLGMLLGLNLGLLWSNWKLLSGGS